MSISTESFTEVCACGARIDWSGHEAYARRRLADFRANHRHDEPPTAVAPGPCWADSGTVWPGQETTVRCDLRAGHAGAHEADRGEMGGTAVWTDESVANANRGDAS